MDKKIGYILLVFSVALMTLLGACSKDESLLPESSREVVFTATMPAPQPSTLLESIAVSSNDESLNLVAKWKEGDKIQIYVRQNDKVYKVDQLCSIYDIDSDGKTCSFIFSLPATVDAEKDYDVIGVTGVSTTYVSGSDVIAVSQLKRAAVEANGDVASPLWFVTTKNASSAGLKAQFQHLGTYEVLYVKNKSKSSMMFRHSGFEVSKKWYKASDNTVLSTAYNPSTTASTGEVESDKSITIPAGGSGRILSWYIPSGAKITNARLNATVGGKSVQTADTITSTSVIERGRAYHMTVTWDGKELRFNERDLCPNNNHPHEIDLGLPSGTKWACCNIGASSPDGYGNYYAWGETQPKSVYNWSTYKWGSAYTFKFTKYCTQSSYGRNGFVDNKTELDPADDAACKNWINLSGSSWRMPSLIQIQELVNNCTWQWTQRNGVNGQLLTSKINGASLFLPASGSRWNAENDDAVSYGYAGSDGYYWSRTLSTSNPSYAYTLYFDSGDVKWESPNRINGRSVRAVRVP